MAVSILSKKIIAGGGGNWGTEHVMSAHPQLSIDEADGNGQLYFGHHRRKE